MAGGKSGPAERRVETATTQSTRLNDAVRAACCTPEFSSALAATPPEEPASSPAGAQSDTYGSGRGEPDMTRRRSLQIFAVQAPAAGSPRPLHRKVRRRW